MSDDERWVPATTPAVLRALLGGAAVGGAAVAIVLVELGFPLRAADPTALPRTVLLAFPVGPVGETTSAPVLSSVRSAVLGTLPWVSLVTVGWWTTGRCTDDWSDIPSGRSGPVRALHRLLANWLGRGLERLRVRLGERTYRRATVRNGIAVGAGYGLPIAAVVWWTVGASAPEPWLGTSAGAAFAACCGTVGGLLRGARGR